MTLSSIGLVLQRLVALAQAIADADGREVQQHDDRDQQQRGGVHQRASRLDIRALEADVVDVEAEVHELALEVQEREVAVQGEIGV